jgi:hypothetical protein
MKWLRCASATLVAGALAVGIPDRASVPLRAQSVDPCSTLAPLSTRPSTPAPTAPVLREAKAGTLDHDDRRRHLDSLWGDRAAAARRRVSPRAEEPAGVSLDVGEIAVLQDNGDLIYDRNPLDLSDEAMRMTVNAAGGYDVVHVPYSFRQPLGTPLTLGDDEARSVTLPFSFPFFGQSYPAVFVNSNGNLTFGVPNAGSLTYSLSAMVTGAPRIALFFADLDPSAGGRVLTSGDATAFSVTWCGVPKWNSPDTVTAQVTIYPDGAIDMQFSGLTTILDVVIGVSPGATEDFRPLDLSNGGPLFGGGSAIGELFTTMYALSLVDVSRRFLATHADQYDGLSIFTEHVLTTNFLSNQISISNHIEGIGMPLYDFGAAFGTTGRLQSLVNMDGLAKYPDDPLQRFFGESSSAALLAHEFGHRWLANSLIRNAAGNLSLDLLGRDFNHWSFFVDTDGSVMEGNDIADLGDGAFRTVGAVERFSLLDQYAMGLVDQTQVPPFFYVQNPVNVVPARSRASLPLTGVTFNGVRRDVTIEDVIAVAGPRRPSAAESPKTLRHAFVYVTFYGSPVEAAAVSKIDRMRLAFEQFVSAATGSRLSVETRLVVPVVPSVEP